MCCVATSYRNYNQIFYQSWWCADFLFLCFCAFMHFLIVCLPQRREEKKNSFHNSSLFVIFNGLLSIYGYLHKKPNQKVEKAKTFFCLCEARCCCWNRSIKASSSILLYIYYLSSDIQHVNGECISNWCWMTATELHITF